MDHDPWLSLSSLETGVLGWLHDVFILIISSSYLSLWWRDILQMYQFLRGLFVCFYFMFGFFGEGFLGFFFPPWIDSLSHFWEHQDLTKSCSSFESSSKHRGYWLEIPFSVCPSQWITGITPVGNISIFLVKWDPITPGHVSRLCPLLCCCLPQHISEVHEVPFCYSLYECFW